MVPNIGSISVSAVAMVVMPCSRIVLVEFSVGGSISAVPIFVFLGTCETFPMRRVVLLVELLMETLMFKVIISVSKEIVIVSGIMSKGRCS